MLAIRFERGVVGTSYAVSFGTQPLETPVINHINALGGAQVTGMGTVEGEPCDAQPISFTYLSLCSFLGCHLHLQSCLKIMLLSYSYNNKKFFL